MIRDPVPLPPADSELARLVELMCDGAIDAPQRDRLESLLENDKAAVAGRVDVLVCHGRFDDFSSGKSEYGIIGIEEAPGDLCGCPGRRAR